MDNCMTEGCTNPAAARGMCQSHYYKAKNAGLLEAIAPKHLGPCEQCGAQLPDSRAYGSRFCSRHCKEKFYARQLADAALERRQGRVCEHCGKPIPLTRGGKAKTCSRECSVARSNHIKAQARRGDWSHGPCERCGDQIPEERHRGAKFCSPHCKKLATQARWLARRPGYMRQYKHGITPEEFDAQVLSQGGRCAICGDAKPGGKGGWHVDHDHATGQRRDLLCHYCNLMLGHAKDDPARLRAAADYLDRW